LLQSQKQDERLFQTLLSVEKYFKFPCANYYHWEWKIFQQKPKQTPLKINFNSKKIIFNLDLSIVVFHTKCRGRFQPTTAEFQYIQYKK